jgi:hypothetical protein
MILKDIVRFRGDKLFNGAVNIDWYISDPDKSRLAAEAFVFHGPAYHGVSQDEVGYTHGHKLIDTASFTKAIVKRSYGHEDVPFTLAIAGYGTGKSHLGVTIAELLSAPVDNTPADILANISSADKQIGDEIEILLDDADKPCLVIALNGLTKFDFIHGLSNQIIQVLRRDGHDVKPIEDLRPRFQQAVRMLNWVTSPQLQEELSEICGGASPADIIALLEQQDEATYINVNKFLSKHDMQIRNLQGESVQELIGRTVEVYCGEGNPYQSLVILFDEFGKYMEFASTRSHLAGSGVLQELFEATQAYSPRVCFVGFIQFELNAYLQRMATEQKNEMQRYISRYQTADKLYLSTNLETLIANLIEKKNPQYLDQIFEGKSAFQTSNLERTKINEWFPSSKHIQVWNDADLFHKIVSKGSWPLSAYSVWLLYYLSAVGSHLQERSALALLIEAFNQYESSQISEHKDWRIAAVDMMSNSFIQELLSSEESGAQGTIMQAYQTVMSKYATKYSINQIRILKAVVLSSKLGLVAANRADAIEALEALTNMDKAVLAVELQTLLDEYNAIEWDEAYKSFDILSDALPRSQFINHIRRLSASYDENAQSQLFVSSIKDCCDLIKDIQSDFAEENKISTPEWAFQAKVANLDTLPQQIILETDRWSKAESIDDPRGSVIYVYLGETADIDCVSREAHKLLKSAAESLKVKAVPILLVFLYDVEGKLGQYLTELSILDSLSNEELAKFGNLVESHRVKIERSIQEAVEALLKEKRYISLGGKQMEGLRLSKAATELFKQIYTHPILFPFDGFATSRGNAADTCSMLTRELMHSTLDYSTVMAKPVRDKNRANSVLKDAWGIFSANGKINRRPTNNILKKLSIEWDEILQERMLSLREMYDTMIKPPFGANQDSAGLFLSVYISPRSNTLNVFINQQYTTVNGWADDNLIRSKHFNPSIMDGAYLLLRSDDTSEWENLLDEWEQAESHIARVDCMERSEVLKEKIPVPPELFHREQRLTEQANESAKKIDEMEEAKDDAIMRIKNNTENGNVIPLSWGCSSLKRLIAKLESEKPLWIDEQIDDMRPVLVEGRQTIIQVFPDWLAHISPKSESPDHVGEFKHLMLNKVKPNLEDLGLDNEASNLDARVRSLIRRVEDVAEARRLISEVDNWIRISHGVLGTNRLKDIRVAKDVAKSYASKLKGMFQRINLNELIVLRKSLKEFYDTLTNSEKEITKRADKVWKSKITTEDSIDELLEELDSLIRAYDGLESDLEDFHILKKALHQFKRSYGRLSDINLTWSSFDTLSTEVEQETVSKLAEDELPWPPEDVIKNVVKTISDSRKQLSKEWADSILAIEPDIPDMNVASANQLQNKLSSPPAYVTDAHLKKLEKVRTALDKRLSEIKIEWLVEKFKELSEKDRKKFIKLVSE